MNRYENTYSITIVFDAENDKEAYAQEERAMNAFLKSGSFLTKKIEINRHIIDDIDDTKEKQGEWIHSFYSEDNKDVYKCSECGRFITLDKSDNLSNYPYCHCGADMRVKMNEEI